MNTTSIQDLVRRNPLAFSALVAGTVLAVNLVLKLGSVVLSLELSVLTTGGLSAALLSAVGALAITRLGLWHELGLLGWRRGCARSRGSCRSWPLASCHGSRCPT